jgi:hypothetical protein
MLLAYLIFSEGFRNLDKIILLHPVFQKSEFKSIVLSSESRQEHPSVPRFPFNDVNGNCFYLPIAFNETQLNIRLPGIARGFPNLGEIQSFREWHGDALLRMTV